MLLLKLFAKHVLLPLLLPIAVVEVLLNLSGKPTHLLSWEVGSIIHTIWVSWKLMDTDQLPFMTKRTLQWLRALSMGGVGLLLLGKILFGWIELDDAAFRLSHPRLCEIVTPIMPHWLMLPPCGFFLVNLSLLLLSRKSRKKAHLADEHQQESEFLHIILQVDVPVVIAYLIVLPYGLFLIASTPATESNVFFRGVACTLLLVSNLLTVAYDYLRIRKIRKLHPRTWSFA